MFTTGKNPRYPIMKTYSYLLFPAALASLAVTTSVKAEEVSAKAADPMGASNLLAQSSDPAFTPTFPTTTPSTPVYTGGDVNSDLPASNYSYGSLSVGFGSQRDVDIKANVVRDKGFELKTTGKILIAQNAVENIQEPKVIKLRLSDTGISIGGIITWGLAGLIQKRSTDWVRLEVNDTKVKVVHTTRVTNWLTQFSKWWDHPVRKIMFKSDSCESNTCTISGEDGIIDLKDTTLLHQGTFQVEYLENNEWKYVAFRVPQKNL